VKDPNAHVACETMVAADHVVVAGEIGTEAEVDVESVVRRTVRSIGYDREDLRFWHDGVVVDNLLRPIYLPTAAFGHFGREDGAFTWEDVDEVVARLK